MTDENQLSNIVVEGAAEEDHDESEELDEHDGDQQEFDEEYDRWGAAERHTHHLKPLVIGLLVFAAVAAGAVAFAVSGSDPADKFDSAPIVNIPGEGSALSVTGVSAEPIKVEARDARPRPVREDAQEPEPVEAETEPAPIAAADPVAEPAVEAAAVPDATQIEAAAEVVEAAAEAVAGYDEVLAMAKQARGRKAKQELLRQAIEVNPRGDEALAQLALMLMESGKTREEALDLASRAVEANPDNGLAWLVIGYVKQVIGKAAEARDAYRKCAGCSGPTRYVRECRQLG